jgi:hypothetical protein
MCLQLLQLPQLSILQFTQLPHFFFFLALMAHCWDLANLSMMLSRWVVLVVFINLTGEFFFLELIFFAGDNLEEDNFFLIDFFFMGDDLSTMLSRLVVLVTLTGEFFILEFFFAGGILKKDDFLIDDFFFMGDDMMLGNAAQIVCVILSAAG